MNKMEENIHTHTNIHTGLHSLQIPSQRDCMQNLNNIFKITPLHEYCEQQSVKKKKNPSPFHNAQRLK